MKNQHFTTLPNRARIILSGPDRAKFLQGLITNDMGLLEQKPVIYSWLLSPQGKFLFDFFLHRAEDKILIDCEGGPRGQELYNRLLMYKLRADIELELEESATIYDAAGLRTYQRPAGEERPFEDWDKARIAATIPDGTSDLIPNKDTPATCNLEVLGGLSYEKGCYVGQEPVARTHYKGLAKKHLRAIQGAEPLPPFGTEIRANDNTLIGEMRSSQGNVGLAMLKDEYLDRLIDTPLRLL